MSTHIEAILMSTHIKAIVMSTVPTMHVFLKTIENNA